MRHILRFLPIVFLLTTSCQRAPEAVALPTATTVRVAAALATQARPVQAVASQVAFTPTAVVEETTLTPEMCALAGDQLAAQHTVEAAFDYTAHVLRAEQRVRVLNRTGESLAQLVFDVEPNRFPNVFQLDAVQVGGEAVPVYEMTGRRLTLELATPLAPGCSADVQLAFRITLPEVGEGAGTTGGFFGYTARQVNLGHWLPTLAARQNGAWVTHEVAAIGEQLILDVADWDVRLTVLNAPADLQIAAPGDVTSTGDAAWQVRLPHSRDLALSLSPEFRQATAVTATGAAVELYTLRSAEHPQNGETHALEVAAQSLTTYSDLFGAYPYSRYVVVEGDFSDGMEFSGIVFVSKDWFRTYEGDPHSYLTIITVHETAHQWWYARVGNDQAFTPWLDEALATYSEYMFYEAYYPELRDWWWGFRVDTFVPDDFTRAVDGSVYQFSTTREYINAVYLRGARMLDLLRNDLGTEAFFDWLSRYAETGAGRIVPPDAFWTLLTPEQLAQTLGTRGEYLSAEALEIMP